MAYTRAGRRQAADRVPSPPSAGCGL